MKKTIGFIAAAITVFALISPASAKGFFIGGDLGMVSYPDYSTDTVNWLYSQSATYASATQQNVALTLGIHGGQWITGNFGWEAGFSDLGSVNGSYSSDAVVAYPYGDYTYSASALHAAALLGVPVGRGKLFAKVGVFSASTTLDDPYATQTAYSTGLLVGGGYELWIDPQLSARFGFNLYNNVKFINEGTYSIDNKTMGQVTVGINEIF